VESIDASFWQGRRVLITGHTGFTGAWLTTWLEQLGAQVTGLARRPPPPDSLFCLLGLEAGTESLVGDVRDPASLERALQRARPELVIHLAGQPIVARALADPAETYATNVMGTVHLLDALRRAEEVRAAILVTSDRCYAPRGGQAAYREEEALGGVDPYSSSKACAELVVAAFRRSYFTDGGPQLATARTANAIGGGDRGPGRLVPDFVRAAEQGLPLRVRQPDAQRQWQHVLAPLHGYLLLAQALWGDADHATGWNFGPALQDVWPVRRIADRLVARWPQAPAWEEERGGSEVPAPVIRLDCARAAERLGWRPRWQLGEALGAVVSWHLAACAGEDMGGVTRRQIANYFAAEQLPLPV
jgi:CDP-glucose 4,6-dehydratase